MRVRVFGKAKEDSLKVVLYNYTENIFNAMDPYTDNIVLMASIQFDMFGTWQEQCQELIIYMMLA